MKAVPRLYPGRDRAALWSADGRMIYYLFTNSTGLSDVNAIAASGGTPRAVVGFDT